MQTWVQEVYKQLLELEHTTSQQLRLADILERDLAITR